MVELMPGQQEGSDVKYTLTSQIIHNIFTEFPSGKPPPPSSFTQMTSSLTTRCSEKGVRCECTGQGTDFFVRYRVDA